MAQETKAPKWEGKATTELKNTTVDQVWSLFEDFCAIHKWLPTVDISRHVEGDYGKPGLVRYCATSPKPNDSDHVITWCYEKLLSMDPVQRRFSYTLGENNLGLTFYVAVVTVTELDGGGCQIEWGFTADPVEVMREEDLCGSIESALKGMAKNMEMEFQPATN